MTTMVVLAMSDIFWQAAIAGIVTITLAYMADRTKRAAVAAAHLAAARVQEVKKDLADTANSTNGKLETIHKLVNSALGVQLNLVAQGLRRIAILENTPENNRAAEIAEKAYQDHIASQP